MAFGSIELTTISRAQDYTSIKHNEDHKGFVDQTNIGHQVQKDTEQRTKEVHSADTTDWHTKQFDAKEKSDNEYQGDGGNKRKKQEKHEKVIVKGRQGFDMKV